MALGTAHSARRSLFSLPIRLLAALMAAIFFAFMAASIGLFGDGASFASFLSALVLIGLGSLLALFVVGFRTKDPFGQDVSDGADEEQLASLSLLKQTSQYPLDDLVAHATSLRRSGLRDDQQIHGEILSEAAASLQLLIHDSFTLAQAETGSIRYEQVDFALHTLYERLTERFALEADVKGLSLDLNIAPDLPVYLKGDPDRIQQVLAAVISDAITAAQTGEIRVNASQSGAGDERQIRFEIIAPCPVRSDALPNKEDKTRALGLMLGRKFIEGMGGIMEFGSTSGGDHVVRLLLPLRVGLRPPGMDQGERDMDLSPLLILVAEDDEASRIVARSMLESMGHSVLEAQNGVEAVSMAEQSRPDVILMDMAMPVMDGLAASKLLRDHQDPDLSAIPIVAITNQVVARKRQSVNADGLTCYLSKPLDKQALKETLFLALDGHAFVERDCHSDP